MASDSYYMGLALEAAREGLAAGEVPVGAVMVDEAGEILAQAQAFNRPMALTGSNAYIENSVQVLVAGVQRTRNTIKLSIVKVIPNFLI